ncbi:MAG TPA: histidinol dehydrogenase [Luteibaculaceae bacterium]|nr:histidinol dehydrogenase [Luteibaculaceae bacterium]
MLTSFTNPPKSEWSQLLARPSLNFNELKDKVDAILRAVRINGDRALVTYNSQFDGYTDATLAVTTQEIIQSAERVDHQLKEAIQGAIRNVRTFHQSQWHQEDEVETMPGVRCSRRWTAIDRVGLYIPGGSAPLFSTVIMLGVPAQIAGVKEVILCTPPNSKGEIHPAILYSASQLGIQKIYKTGGAQAIAAMAYGTETVEKCDKIFGPGNQYVACAKALVSMEGVGIDMLAGPSEVAVIADQNANPYFVAADLLSQAEHGPDSQVMLFTTDDGFAKKVATAIEELLEELPRKEIAQKALRNSKAFYFEHTDELVEMVNQYACEHLIINTINAREWSERITNAGSIFLGPYSPESVGDYASGTNHTLPTNGFARYTAGVSVDSFIKKITIQELSSEGIRQVGPWVECMAEAEGLHAHKLAVRVRLNTLL